MFPSCICVPPHPSMHLPAQPSAPLRPPASPAAPAREPSLASPPPAARRPSVTSAGEGEDGSFPDKRRQGPHCPPSELCHVSVPILALRCPCAHSPSTRGPGGHISRSVQPHPQLRGRCTLPAPAYRKLELLIRYVFEVDHDIEIGSKHSSFQHFGSHLGKEASGKLSSWTSCTSWSGSRADPRVTVWISAALACHGKQHLPTKFRTWLCCGKHFTTLPQM